jgi:hypothetical protein
MAKRNLTADERAILDRVIKQIGRRRICEIYLQWTEGTGRRKGRRSACSSQTGEAIPATLPFGDLAGRTAAHGIQGIVSALVL